MNVVPDSLVTDLYPRCKLAFDTRGFLAIPMLRIIPKRFRLQPAAIYFMMQSMSPGKPATVNKAETADHVEYKSSMHELFDALPPHGEEWKLASQIDPDRLPKHIAIIMDGNGRWAQRRFMPRVAGHRAGVNAVRDVTETSARLGIEALTLYAFSLENWKRPRAEVETLWRLLRQYLRQEFETLMDNNVRLHAFGRVDALPPIVRETLDETIESTSKNNGLRLNLAINYGGRAEIIDAVNSIIERAQVNGRTSDLNITEEDIANHLYTRGLPDPDLLIRTSGEMRVSNFLLWQIAYAELHVTETLWPDFRRLDLLKAILDYQKRDRRFGGLSPAGLRAEEVLEVAAPAR